MKKQFINKIENNFFIVVIFVLILIIFSLIIVLLSQDQNILEIGKVLMEISKTVAKDWLPVILSVLSILIAITTINHSKVSYLASKTYIPLLNELKNYKTRELFKNNNFELHEIEVIRSSSLEILFSKDTMQTLDGLIEGEKKLRNRINALNYKLETVIQDCLPQEIEIKQRIYYLEKVDFHFKNKNTNLLNEFLYDNIWENYSLGEVSVYCLVIPEEELPIIDDEGNIVDFDMQKIYSENIYINIEEYLQGTYKEEYFSKMRFIEFWIENKNEIHSTIKQSKHYEYCVEEFNKIQKDLDILIDRLERVIKAILVPSNPFKNIFIKL